jgi:hypothetical protein
VEGEGEGSTVQSSQSHARPGASSVTGRPTILACAELPLSSQKCIQR